ncbi:short-chain dehydrogenase/reductase SDR [Tepidicaulis marinus]|uniref:Short-chain dehydrogenase/reductase SDR n=1 Tax=Tepidicaulis marinus TaxID=1333998 RepID=A0A081B7C6_9HYPH|nr:SDR family NAD(P)-dependent oxidoreductase [Tepidicaulis marinus]GAK43944.1 short-chain dehydrogenase/reductase SDR [Tepidicaulis marinus]
MSGVKIASQDLSGKIALVTGATSGLGLRFARVLAASGAAVAIAGRRVERLDELAKKIASEGGKALPVALDVTDAAGIETAMDKIEAQLGPLDILVNNAGMNVQAMATDVTPEAYDQIMGTNTRGAFFMATSAGRRMIARGAGGRIINIASIGAHSVLPGLAVYCMSKAATAMMTKSLAREWAKHEINVNAICPGYIRTELNSEWFDSAGGQKQIAGFPRKRLGEDSDLDGTLLLLAGDQGRLITGSLFTVDDGQSLKPA